MWSTLYERGAVLSSRKEEDGYNLELVFDTVEISCIFGNFLLHTYPIHLTLVPFYYLLEQFASALHHPVVTAAERRPRRYDGWSF